MTTTSSYAPPPSSEVARTAVPATCCRRPMTSIEVTARGTTLVLHSCSACGRHLWVRDGQPADRSDLIDGVKTFLEEPRPPVRRRRRKTA